MACDLSLFSEYVVFSGDRNYIRVPDGRKVPVKHIGTVRLQSNPIIELKHVLHVLDFQFNLISVPKLCEDMDCQVVFNSNTCHIQGHSVKERPTVLGKLQAGLYSFTPSSITEVQAGNFEVLGVNQSNKKCFSVSSNVTNEEKLWHLRLGHVPFLQLRSMLPYCNVKSVVHDSICKICPKAKQTKLSFPQSSIRTKFPFALLHIDL